MSINRITEKNLQATNNPYLRHSLNHHVFLLFLTGTHVSFFLFFNQRSHKNTHRLIEINYLSSFIVVQTKTIILGKDCYVKKSISGCFSDIQVICFYK